ALVVQAGVAALRLAGAVERADVAGVRIAVVAVGRLDGHADAGPAGLSRTLPEQRRAVGVRRAGLAARVDGRMHAHHALAGVLRAGIVVVAGVAGVAAVGRALADASLGGVTEDHDAEVVWIRRA